MINLNIKLILGKQTMKRIEVRLYLQDILGCSVDLGTLKALKEHLREPVLKDVIHAFIEIGEFASWENTFSPGRIVTV